MPDRAVSKTAASVVVALASAALAVPGPAAYAEHPRSTSGTPAVIHAAPDPATTVRTFFDAINEKDYKVAWALGGFNLTPSYPIFVHGFATTKHDKVTILGTDGDVVSVRLVAHHTDGAVIHYQGAYTVFDGLIIDGHLVAS